ncbi:MAG: type II secretion system protein [Patescibacteria group bacterium]|nr:type II secretion system protein [Patescibacteria group bacterium]
MSIIPPSKKSGFTLIEIVIVLAIAALIMVIVFVAVQGALMGRRNDQRRSDARRVLAAVESNPELYLSATAGQDVSDLTRRLIGVNTACGFEDPSISNSIGISCTSSSTARQIKMRITTSTGTGVAPWIEIKKDYKCDGNVFSQTSSPGSNAVMFVLEPFTVSGTNRNGINSCINT